MSTLIERVREYALGRGIELLIVEGPDIDRYATARDGLRTYLVIDAGTAAGSRCGDVVYRACQQISAAQRLKVFVRPRVRPALAS